MISVESRKLKYVSFSTLLQTNTYPLSQIFVTFSEISSTLPFKYLPFSSCMKRSDPKEHIETHALLDFFLR